MSEDLNSPAGIAQGWATAAVSIVNGFFGDYLSVRQNGLAIDMAFYQDRRPLPLSPASLLRAHPQPSGKVCVLVHGLASNEGVWAFPDPANPAQTTSYGARLHAEHGYAPLFLRYNTGLPIAANGQRLAALLDELLASYPTPIEELLLIGHSMGGLVLRSACHWGQQRQLPWVAQAARLIYLGTPHDGADLERLAHATTATLQAVPNPITRIIGRVLHQRSQGVKDLRFGAPLTSDGAAQTPPPEAPWLATAEHLFLAGALNADVQHPATRWFGDGLVRISGAAATHGQPPAPTAPAAQVQVLPRVHHLQLTRDPAIYEQISAWCGRAPQE